MKTGNESDVIGPQGQISSAQTGEFCIPGSSAVSAQSDTPSGAAVGGHSDAAFDAMMAQDGSLIKALAKNDMVDMALKIAFMHGANHGAKRAVEQAVAILGE